MAFDFPASPSVGQEYTLNGVSYAWNGYAWMQSAAPPANPTRGLQHGQCRFVIVSNSQCILTPYNGNRLIIDNVEREIPAAGVTVSNAGLVASTNYNVFAKYGGGAISLEALAIGHELDPRNGARVAVGDPTKTLVGKVNPGASNLFYNSGDYLGVLSWFNRRRLRASTSPSFTTTSTANVAVTGSAILAVNWGDELVEQHVSGYQSNSAANCGGQISTRTDSIIVNWPSFHVGTIANGPFPTAIYTSHTPPAEGRHSYDLVLAAVNGGTAAMNVAHYVETMG